VRKGRREAAVVTRRGSSAVAGRAAEARLARGIRRRTIRIVISDGEPPRDGYRARIDVRPDSRSPAVGRAADHMGRERAMHACARVLTALLLEAARA